MANNIDWDKFLERTKMSKSDAARKLGAAPAMMTGWLNGKNPGYAYLRKLCEVGMTAQEMFGEKAGDALVRNSSEFRPKPEVFESPEFKAGVVRTIEDMKKMGLIK